MPQQTLNWKRFDVCIKMMYMAGITIPQIIKDVGFDFDWDTTKVWALKEPTVEMPMNELAWHFDIPFWSSEGTAVYNLSPKEVMEHPDRESTHWRLIQAADTTYPIDIMENKGRWLILDGLHRLAKEYVAGKTTVSVRKIPRSRISEIEAQSSPNSL